MMRSSEKKLNSSQLLSFMTPHGDFVFHFLEGQKLILDLVILHGPNSENLQFFRKAVLSFQPLISFLKPDEGFGIYIDAQNPQSHFKIETNHSGKVRSLLIPEELPTLPEKLQGICRVSKTFKGKKPYTSIVEINDLTLDQLANHILNTSYQVNGKLFVSQDSDQSALLLKLPEVGGKTKEHRQQSLDSFSQDLLPNLESVFKKYHNETNLLIEEFKKFGLNYLCSREIELFCPCSKDSFLDRLSGLPEDDRQHLFKDGEKQIEVNCDYCKSKYLINKGEIFGH